jgi:hypothetical protein
MVTVAALQRAAKRMTAMMLSFDIILLAFDSFFLSKGLSTTNLALLNSYFHLNYTK